MAILFSFLRNFFFSLLFRSDGSGLMCHSCHFILILTVFHCLCGASYSRCVFNALKRLYY